MKSSLKAGGLSGTRAYVSWAHMIARCTNPEHPAFADYGGRGIAVCERWKDFKLFFQDMGERPEGHELDRRNNNGNYEPGNCRWATDAQQAVNKRNTCFVLIDGQRISLAEAARRAGISRKTAYFRFMSGKTGADLIAPPMKKKGPDGRFIRNGA